MQINLKSNGTLVINGFQHPTKPKKSEINFFNTLAIITYFKDE